ncbi:MAG TPA: acylphosphatase [Solirubrobacteraceae bacterium]|nr:acylphosphatase [Solirubrobacteraceae bacterium]
MSEVVARRIVASGRVQGVFFRDSTRREAIRLGVAGWVRNCPDGTVEAHVEGAPDAVGALVRWAREGPRHADVDALRVSDAEPEHRARFEIRSH